jgi:hypothetical protein
MTEQVPPEASDAAQDPSTNAGHRPSTGVPGVDRVVAALDRLDDLPLEQHLGAFERAHGSLRAALDSGPEPPA